MSLSKEELKLVKETKERSTMCTKDECIAFEENIYKLSQNKSPEMLVALLDLFDDNCSSYEVMYTLVHIVETYPIDMYIHVLLSNIENTYKYKNWFLRLLRRIINHEQYKNSTIEQMLALFHGVDKFFEKLRQIVPQCTEEINEIENKCLC